MDTIINISFNKHPMSRELIHCRLIHTSESDMKAMCSHQNLSGIPKHLTKKINESPCTICCTEKMTTFPKVTTVDTTKLQPGERIHMDF